jgi:hypothetical protein
VKHEKGNSEKIKEKWEEVFAPKDFKGRCDSRDG